jgi:serine/threonine protein kinase/outer membrane protein assembly factor BamB
MNEETLFHLTREKPAAERAAFLDEACAGDGALRRRVEDLLAADAAPGNFLEHESAASVAQAMTHAAEAGGMAVSPLRTNVRSFGDYELLEEIARGGMGVVYRARQVSLDRIVALKMILSGELASPADVQRFQAEARTAASLQHPNIVAIHEVGEHEGQHYFSMDFVEGRSLAEAIRTAPLPPGQAARYVRIVAEAIHFAHQQGVLHRDLKPSNVLIDRFDQPRVTDFGLAKQIANPQAKGLPRTVTRAVVGTPSYMPPEQASGDRGKLGPASDVYSLGAVLYELVTGRPPFQAANILDTLLQVLDSEPAPPRLLNPGVNRDLETIILKCLAKEPGRRYSSAANLAEDLGAFLEGRSIQARRPSLPEKGLRWLRRQRRSVLLASVAAVASVLLVAGTFVAWQQYRESQQDSFLLTTDGQALDVELFDEHGQAVLPAFTAPTRQPVSVPAGLYDMRLSGPRQLSETYQLLVEQGATNSFEAALMGRPLWEPIAVPKAFEVMDLGGRSDVIVVSDRGLRRINGATGKDVWPGGERSMARNDQPAVADVRDYDWAELTYLGWQGYHPRFGLPPSWVVRPAPDLDGDGTPYLVLASLTKPWLLAVSSKDGAAKWLFRGPHAIPQGPGDAYGVLCPVIAADVDGDGMPDLIAAFGSPNEPTQTAWVEAVSGRTGRKIWAFLIDKSRAPTKETYRLKANYPAGMARVGDKCVLVAVGRRLVGLDLRTGKPIWPARELDVEPLTRPVFLNVRGQPAVLSLSREGAGDFTLTAHSLTAGPVWRHRVSMAAQKTGQPYVPEVTWPVVEDLDGDGKAEVLVPFNDRGGSWENGWVGVEVLDGATGQSRWQRRLCRAYGWSAETDGFAHLLVGPDLDGDGHREVFTAALIQGQTFGAAEKRWFLLVAAVSGADGRVLWQHLRPVSEVEFSPDSVQLGSMSWCQSGGDGRPQLLVSLAASRLGRRRDLPTRTLKHLAWVFSAGDGKMAHGLPDLSMVGTADLDGNGIPDLYGLRPDAAGLSGTLHGFRGGPPELWRRLGTWHPAFAGNAEDDFNPAYHLSPPLPHGDLDGDGVPDLLVFSTDRRRDTLVGAPLQAYSGKGGRRLWKAGGIQGTLRFSNDVSECFHLECRDLKGNGRPDVLVAYGVGDFGTSTSRKGIGVVPDCQGWLAVLSGSNGELLWKEKIGGFEVGRGTAKWCPKSLALQPPAIADLNGDGVQDVVVLAQTASSMEAPWAAGRELRALDGRNGQVLWKYALPHDSKDAAVISRVEGGGSVEVALACSAGGLHVVVLNGKNGQPKWTWAEAGNFGWYTPKDLRGYMPQVLADLGGTGRPSACLPVVDPQKRTYQILVLDPPGRVRHTLDVQPADPEKVAFRLWSQDLNGEGKEELVFVSAGKVRVIGLVNEGPQPAEKLLWEWPLPDGVGDILDVLPAGQELPAVVVVRSGGRVYGLDGRSGRLRWRCEGPGQPVAVLPGHQGSGLPAIVFHETKPESTVCRQALPVGPDGKYGQPTPTRVEHMSSPDDRWTLIPLPWEQEARQKVVRGVLMGLPCLLLPAYFALRRKRRIALTLLACLFLMPLGVALIELKAYPILPEQRHAWSGWYWLWPYTLSAPGDSWPLALGVVCCLWWMTGAHKRVAFGLFCLLYLGWITSLSFPDGFSLKSPLVWMVAGLFWVQAGRKRKSGEQTGPTPAAG